MSDTSPAAGWYADPENPAGERWWNGSGWSDNKRDSTAGAEPAAAAVADPAGFTFGSPAAARPDPYAPAQPVSQPYYAATPAYGAPASPYVAAPYGAPAPGQGVNGLALAGLLVGAVGWLIVGVLAGIAGLILSIFGLQQAKRREAAGHPQPGRGLAMAGIVVGIIVLALSVIVIVIYVAFLATTLTRY